MLHHTLSARFLSSAASEISERIWRKAAVCESLENRTLFSTGALDTSFNKTGVAVLNLGNGFTVDVNDTVVQSDGKTIVVGDKYTANTNKQFAVVRFNLDGTLDNTFGPNHNGVDYFVVGDSDKDCWANVVTLDFDGKIVVAGAANNDTNLIGNTIARDMAVVRLNSDGSVDSTFGKVIINFGEDPEIAEATAITIASNNQVLVGGTVDVGILNPTPQWAIAKLTTTGKYDTTFDGDGKREIDFGTNFQFLESLAYDNTGNSATNPHFGTIIAVGASSTRTITARFKSNGGDDTSFDGDGSSIDNFPSASETRAYGSLIQGDGKIVVVGTAGAGDALNVVMTRYNPDGHNDSTFGPNGNSWVSVDLGGKDFGFDVLRSYQGGLIVSAGGAKNALIGFSADGKIDTSFGPNSNGIAPAKSVGRVASGPGRRFVVTGGGTSGQFSVSRYLDAGANLVGLSFGFDNTASEAGADSAIVYVTRSERLATTTTVYFTFGGTASGPGTIPASQIDYTGVPTPDPMRPFTHFVVIQPNETIAQFTITAKDDTRAEFDETATFTVLSDPGYEIGTPSTVTINIPDNDRQISGTVFNDVNNNGTKDAGDPPLSGWTVYVDKNNNKSFDAGEPSLVTGTTGQYLFGGLSAGSYSVREVLQSGYQQTLPAASGAYTVTVGPGLLNDNKNFGVNIPTIQKQLTGTVIGTTGSYNNSGNTRDKAFDGNLTTFFDAPAANKDNAWVGLDLGSPQVVNEVKFAPRANYASRMVGGTFQASKSADFSNSVITLFNVSTAPTAGALTDIHFNNAAAFRYVRYLAPAGSYGDVAEVQFWGPSTQQSAPKLTGTTIGTTGSYNNNGNTRDKAFDGNTATWFDAPVANKDNAWVGLDLGSAKHITRIRFTPRANYASRMVGGKFQASNTADFSSGVVDILTITSTPSSSWNDLNINVAGTFRYVRYLGPAGSYGNVAEIEFYGG